VPVHLHPRTYIVCAWIPRESTLCGDQAESQCARRRNGPFSTARQQKIIPAEMLFHASSESYVNLVGPLPSRQGCRGGVFVWRRGALGRAGYSGPNESGVDTACVFSRIQPQTVPPGEIFMLSAEITTRFTCLVSFVFNCRALLKTEDKPAASHDWPVWGRPA